MATQETRPLPRLERAVDRLISLIFAQACREADEALLTVLRQAARRRKAGDLEGALAVLSRAETAGVRWDLACRAFSEWLRLARKVYRGKPLLLYRPSAGQAALLEVGPEPGTVRAVAVLGLRWERGKVLSVRCLRGLRPLRKGAP